MNFMQKFDTVSMATAQEQVATNSKKIDDIMNEIKALCFQMAAFAGRNEPNDVSMDTEPWHTLPHLPRKRQPKCQQTLQVTGSTPNAKGGQSDLAGNRFEILNQTETSNESPYRTPGGSTFSPMQVPEVNEPMQPRRLHVEDAGASEQPTGKFLSQGTPAN